MFTRATTYNIIDRTYHGGGAKFNCFLFSFFFFMFYLGTPRRCILDRSRAGVSQGARRRRVANPKGDLSRAADKPDGTHGTTSSLSRFADLTHCPEARRRRGNIRMGRYSGCVDRSRTAPRPLVPANRRRRVHRHFTGTSRGCYLRKALALFLGHAV